MACGICGLAVDTYCRAKASVFDHESGESGFGQSSRGMAVPGGRYLKVRIGGKPGPRPAGSPALSNPVPYRCNIVSNLARVVRAR
jgi:hypothetical protein